VTVYCEKAVAEPEAHRTAVVGREGEFVLFGAAFRGLAKQNFVFDALNDSNRQSSGRSENLRTHPCLSRQHSKVIISLRPQPLHCCHWCEKPEWLLWVDSCLLSMQIFICS
jgi:hypothetical protein